MIWPHFEAFAETAAARVLNSLPEGLLIALVAWMMLRLLPRQNSGTRFAVWAVSLLAVAGLPFVGGATAGYSLPMAGVVRPLISVPGRWGLLLFLAWALAASIALLRLVIGLWRLRGLRRSCAPIDQADLDPAVRKTVDEFTSIRAVTLATSEHVSVPAAIGFFRPMIVIPTWALQELPPEELNIVLLHEFAHLRRWDDWTNLLQKIVRAVFLFHPAVWWIESRLSLEREMACDDAVLAQTANPRAYATCLVTLLEKNVARRGWAMAQALVHRARQASLRLEQILDSRRPNTCRVWTPALGLVGAFSLACLMIVPRAPRFVAFEHSPQASHSDQAHSATLSDPHFPASVIPAAMRMSSSSLAASPKRLPAQSAGRAAGHRSAPPRALPAISADNRRPESLVSEAATQSASPPAETLLLFRATQRLGPNSWQWSVYVWRVTLVHPVQREAEAVPVPKKT